MNLLTISGVIKTLGISRTTFWRLRQDETFPLPLMVSERSPRWVLKDVLDYFQNNTGK